MSDIELIFHVGMGKTGTTSIQSALGQNSSWLLEHGVYYLGMWFTMLDQSFAGLDGTQRFLSRSPEEKDGYAARFLEFVAREKSATKANRFVISNESLSERPGQMIPFVKALINRGAQIRVIAYVRDPASWLQSAYSQWAIKHKTVQGPVRPFSSMAPGLLNQYDSIVHYSRHFGNKMVVRHFDQQQDVVVDFLQQIGVDDVPKHERKLVRDELAESLLRREFNNLFLEPKLPSEFDGAIWGARPPGRVQRLADVVSSTYDEEALRTALQAKAETFDYIQSVLALDIDLSVPDRMPVDIPVLKDRLLDYLMSIVVRLAYRVERLEAEREIEGTAATAPQAAKNHPG